MDRIALIGVGASTLADRLVADGYRNIDAVDLSGIALQQLSVRLHEQHGAVVPGVRYLEADATKVRFDGAVDVWHDRATFHFLVDPEDQRAYVARAEESVRPGGHLILAGFSEQGPLQCSGLDVARHSEADIDSLFGESFEVVDRFVTTHVTPWGSDQSFLTSTMRRT